MHQPLRVRDPRPVSLADRLMAEAYAEDREIRSQLSDDLNADACRRGIARSRRKDDPLRLHAGDLFYAFFIVSNDRDIRIQRPDELIQIIGKAVIIIDQ